MFQCYYYVKRFHGNAISQRHADADHDRKMKNLPRCYIRNQLLKVDEDRHHEFKAHRQLSNLDLSQSSLLPDRNGSETVRKLAGRRQSISQYICGMLNTGEGGCLYLGVTDSGRVAGLMMSPFQKDHFQLALMDLLSRYEPAVPAEMIRTTYVAIQEPDSLPAPDKVGFRTLASKPHALRHSRYCWCDMHSLAALEYGLLHNFYVIEIHVLPWNSTEPRPIFKTEEGKSYMRRYGTTRHLKPQDIDILRQSSTQSEYYYSLSD